MGFSAPFTPLPSSVNSNTATQSSWVSASVTFPTSGGAVRGLLEIAISGTATAETFSVSDGAGNTWVVDVSLDNVGTNGGHVCQAHFDYAAGTDVTTTVTVSWGTAVNMRQGFVTYTTGHDTTSSSDVSGTTAGGAASTSTTVTTSANRTADDELGLTTFVVGNQSTGPTGYPTSGFTGLFNPLDATRSRVGAFMYTIATGGSGSTLSSGALTHSASSLTQPTASIVTYKPAAAVSGAAVAPQPMLMTLTRFTKFGVPQLFFPNPVVASGAQTFTASLAGAITPVGALIKQTTKPLAGAFTPTGTLAKQVGKLLGGTITPSGALALTRLILRSFAGAITPSGNLLKQVNKSLAGAVIPAGALVKAVSKAVGATLTPSGALTKQIFKALSGSVTPSGALTLTRVILRSFAGAITPAGALIRQAQKRAGGTITPAGVVARAISKPLAASIAPVGALAKKISKPFAGVLTLAGSLATFIPSGVKQLFGFDPSGTGRGSSGNPTATRFDAETHNTDAANPSSNDFDPPNPR